MSSPNGFKRYSRRLMQIISSDLQKAALPWVKDEKLYLQSVMKIYLWFFPDSSITFKNLMSVPTVIALPEFSRMFRAIESHKIINVHKVAFSLQFTLIFGPLVLSSVNINFHWSIRNEWQRPTAIIVLNAYTYNIKIIYRTIVLHHKYERCMYVSLQPLVRTKWHIIKRPGET